MWQKYKRNFTNLSTSDTELVALEWKTFTRIASAHHMSIFLQSECYKRYKHFDPDALSPAQKLNLMTELHDAVGYAVKRAKVLKNGNR